MRRGGRGDVCMSVLVLERASGVCEWSEREKHTTLNIVDSREGYN